MLTYKNLNILFFPVLTVLVVLFFLKVTCFLPVLVLIVLYLAIVTVGAFNIRMNFFFTSLNSGKPDKKEIALTFDDGPHPEITPKVLDILEINQARAAFFSIGKNVAKYPEITKAAFEKKHIIANHSYSHSNFFDFLPSAKMAGELEKTNEVIYRTTGEKPRLFRPPFGVTNPLLKKALKKTGLTPAGWSVRSLDTVKSAGEVLERLKKKTHPGAVILLHDTHERIIPVLEDFLPWLQQNGYQITGLDKMLNIEVYEVD